MDKSPFSIAPVSTLQKNELFFHLYLHQNYTGSGSNNTQSIIVKPGLPNSFGNTVVNDWALYDGNGPNAKVVARARGLHINSGMSSDHWQNYFSIVFEDDRFKGSSLQVMGESVYDGEWAIVGGTGEFRLAQGIIYKKNTKLTAEGYIVELDIHAFYSAVQPWTLGA